jgi:hypothetical protein
MLTVTSAGMTLPLSRSDFAQHFVGHADRVRTGAFGDAERHGGLWAQRLREVARFGCRGRRIASVLAGVGDLGDFAQIDGATAEHADDDIADFIGGFEEGAGFDEDFVVAGGEAAGAELPVCLLQHRHEACGAEIARGELHGIEHHAHGAARTADQRRLGHERHLFDLFIDLRGQAAQREMIVTAL